MKWNDEQMKHRLERLLEGLPLFSSWLWILVYIVTLGSVSKFIPDFLLIPTAITLGIGFRKIKKKQKLLQSQARLKRIQNLKDTVHLADTQSQLLNRY